MSGLVKSGPVKLIISDDVPPVEFLGTTFRIAQSYCRIDDGWGGRPIRSRQLAIGFQSSVSLPSALLRTFA